MNRDVKSLLFAALLAGIFILSWRVLQPFIPGLTWAAVLVVTFWPLHLKLERKLKGRRWLSSVMLTLLVAAVVVTPLVLAGIRVTSGGIAAYEWLNQAESERGVQAAIVGEWPWIEDAWTRGKELVGLANVDLASTGMALAKKASAAIATKAPLLLGGAFGLVFSFVVMLAMMLVFFADGPRLVEAIERALPVPRADGERILHDLGLMTRTVCISVGLTALCQGALAGLAFAVLGVRYAATLAAASFFTSFLPGGTALIWGPVAIYLLATGHPWKAGILAALGVGVISSIDNVLRPYFARDGVKLPAMMLFLGLLGGLFAFGLVGVFLGPVVLYLLRELMSVVERDSQRATP